MESLIFVVDSQPEVCKFIKNCLEPAGFPVRTSSNDGLSSDDVHSPSLIIAGLHNDNLFTFADKSVGTPPFGEIPLIVIIDRDSPEQRLKAFNLKAADCLARPFTSRELLLCVKSVLRRPPSLSQPAANAQVADIVIDSWAMKLLVRGIEIATTVLEFRLLEYLARHRGQVFTRDFLLDAVWGEIRFVSPRSVDACIRRIREKIELDSNHPTMIKTVRGVGYRLDALAVWESKPRLVCDCPSCKTKVIEPRRNSSGLRQRSAAAEN